MSSHSPFQVEGYYCILRLIDLKEGQGRKDLISDILSTVHELGLQMTKLSVHHSCLSDLYLEVKARG